MIVVPRRGTRTSVRLAFWSLVLALVAAAPRTQQVAEGIANNVTALPPAARLALTLATGEMAYFDGIRVAVVTPGQPARKLMALPAPAFGSFLVAAGPNHLLFGESSNGSIWLVPLQGPGSPSQLCQLTLNYDAVLLSSSHAVVSAKTGGWSNPKTRLMAVELATGATWELHSVLGASGPVTLDGSGNLFFATASMQFPTPPGLTSILRVPRPAVDLAIQYRQRLDPTAPVVVWSGLDAASDICFDDDGDLFFVDWMNNTIGELNDADRPSPWMGAPIVAFGTQPGAVSLQFLPSANSGVFEPFQPPGDELHVFETDYFSTSGMRSMRPARPDLALFGTSPIPAGTFLVTATNGPSLGIGIMAIAAGSSGSSTALSLFGFEQPLDWNLALQNPPILMPMVFNAQGTANLFGDNPGSSPALQATAQGAFLSTSGVLGATAAVTILFGT